MYSLFLGSYDELDCFMIIQFKNNHEKHESYTVNIELNNCKNNLQKTLDNQISDSISSDCVYNDIESD